MKSMRTPFKKYFLNALIFSLIIGLAGVILFSTLFKAYYLPIYQFILIFFFLLTVILHAFLLNTSTKKMLKFNSKYMLFTVLKMIIYIAFICLYLIFNKENAVPFLITFFIGYLLFTFFEVLSVVSLIRKNNIKP